MLCVNVNHPDFKNLVQMTGLTSLEVRARVADYLEKFGEFPTVDYILERSTTEKALVKEFNLTKRGDHYTNDTNQKLDIPAINNKYRDLEVLEINYPLLGNRIIIKPKALLNRDLQRPVIKMLPTPVKSTLDIFPIYHDQKLGYYLYQYGGSIYRTTCRISKPTILINYPSYNSVDEAKNDISTLPFVNPTYNLVNTINSNLNKLHYDLEISILSNDNLPSQVTINKNIPYVDFEYDETLETPYIQKQGKVFINPRFIENFEDLDKFIMKALGLSDEFIDWALNNPRSETYDILQTSKNLYIVRKSLNKIDVSVAKDEKIARTLHKKSLVPLNTILDRMEELYGVKFNKVNTQLLMEGKFLDIIPNATDVNAFVLDGQIYINMDRATIDAPIHELSHILLGSLKFTNPSLYYKTVSSVENLDNYLELLEQFPNRSRSDANEEIFVDLFARYYVNLADLPIDDLLKEKLEYEIKHNIDSGIFPYTSVTKGNSEDIMLSSLLEIMDEFGTCINKDAIIKAFENGTVYHRKLANLKELLIKNGDLKEYCTEGNNSINISHVHKRIKIK